MNGSSQTALATRRRDGKLSDCQPGRHYRQKELECRATESDSRYPAFGSAAGTYRLRSSTGDPSNFWFTSTGSEFGDVRPRRSHAPNQSGMVYLGACLIAGIRRHGNAKAHLRTVFYSERNIGDRSGTLGNSEYSGATPRQHASAQQDCTRSEGNSVHLNFPDGGCGAGMSTP